MSSARTALSRLSTRSPSLSFKLHKMAPSTPLKSTPQSKISDSMKRISTNSRLPLALSSLLSMMPLHSAIASARLNSHLSVESQSWGMIPQGISMPL